jgi:hypothetical protein
VFARIVRKISSALCDNDVHVDPEGCKPRCDPRARFVTGLRM